MFNELREVLNFIIRNLDENQISQKYISLADLYEKARTEPSPDITSQIESASQDLVNSQSNIDLSIFDEILFRILSNFDKEGLLGKSAAERVMNRVNQMGIDPSGAANYLREEAAKINALETRAKTIIENLQGLFTDEQPLAEGMGKLQIVFESKVSINNFDDLENKSKEWSEILTMSSQIFQKGLPDSQIISIHKGSPTILTITAPEQLVSALGVIIFAALKIKEKLLNIKKLELEIDLLEIDKASKFKKLFNESEAKTLKHYIDEATTKIIEEHKKLITGYHKNIAKASITFLVTRIYNFTALGGIATVVKSENINDSNILRLNSYAREIKSTEIELKVEKLILANVPEMKVTELNKSKRQSSMNKKLKKVKSTKKKIN